MLYVSNKERYGESTPNEESLAGKATKRRINQREPVKLQLLNSSRYKKAERVDGRDLNRPYVAELRRNAKHKQREAAMDLLSTREANSRQATKWMEK